LNEGNLIWVTNVGGLLSYVTKFKDDRNTCLDIDMERVEKHVCGRAEVVENRFYLGTKENLNAMQEFIDDEKECYLEVDDIRIIKVQEDDGIHVWKYGDGRGMFVNIVSLREYMQDFNIKLKKCDEGLTWMYDPCCSREERGTERALEEEDGTKPLPTYKILDEPDRSMNQQTNFEFTTTGGFDVPEGPSREFYKQMYSEMYFFFFRIKSL